jgi:hypothetical protein
MSNEQCPMSNEKAWGIDNRPLLLSDLLDSLARAAAS